MAARFQLRWLVALGVIALGAFSPDGLLAQDDVKALTTAVANLTAKVDQLSKKVDGFVTKEHLENRLREEVEGINSRIDQLKDLVGDVSAQVDQISVATPTGKYYPNIRGNMQTNPEFRAELSQAVHESMRATGTLVVTNYTATPQQLVVNGQIYTVPPFSPPQRYEVPAGTLVTHLLNYEPPKNWTIAPPRYEQRIGIR
jgi:outer membrane murein-binding lipoprotein Lpp